ncbi:MAG: hypothetical protein A4E20_17860 [Nitrospira sp. SG-bin2]|jgi:hypothetical protein|uniref:hypothetical protein n=1 Tax=Nitrospira cf. moscoviensis SBR1015 TaxID=96242 RepID=UPI000A0A5E72|nr:hypothetical protein [Nitrospira cf. moscoviensis SBR1015]OQW37459.1 MAG: hypothetical protein A4E20_17860 [Nitrospira sp. SG-bin2]
MRQQTFHHGLYALMRFSCFLYVLLLHPLYYVAQAEAQPTEQKDRIAAEQAIPGSSSVYDCIHRLMAENSMERSAVTDIMLFDIVVAEAKKYPEGKIPPEKASADKFCEKHVFKEYKSLYDKAKGQRSARVEGKLAPPGQTAIETESAFLDYANNLTSNEVWGHSEITQDALLDLSCQDHQYQLSDG